MNPWHDVLMPKMAAPKRDYVEVGRAIVEKAIGEQMDANPLPDKQNPHAVALGKYRWN